MNKATEQLPKPIWQLTLAEFLATEPTRTIETRAVSFIEWLAANDLPAEFQSERNILLPQLDYAFNQNRTKAQKGKAKGAYERAETHNVERDRLLNRYAREVPTTSQRVKLDLSRDSDCAAARVMHRRAIRQALDDGEIVPPEVLSEAVARYPELASVEPQSAKPPHVIAAATEFIRQPERTGEPRQMSFNFA